MILLFFPASIHTFISPPYILLHMKQLANRMIAVFSEKRYHTILKGAVPSSLVFNADSALFKQYPD